MPLRPTTKVFQDLLTDIKRTFGDESGVQITNDDIARWANTGQQEIVTANAALKAKAVLPTVVGQTIYAFPQNVQQIEALHYDNMFVEGLPFPTAEQAILSNDPEGTQSGQPQFWYEWAGELTVWPKPDAVKNLTLYYTAYPEKLTGLTSQLLSVPDKFYAALCDFVLSKAYEMDEDFPNAQAAEQRFRVALDAQAEDERQGAHMTYPVIQEVW